MANVVCRNKCKDHRLPVFSVCGGPWSALASTDRGKILARPPHFCRCTHSSTVSTTRGRGQRMPVEDMGGVGGARRLLRAERRLSLLAMRPCGCNPRRTCASPCVIRAGAMHGTPSGSSSHEWYQPRGLGAQHRVLCSFTPTPLTLSSAHYSSPTTGCLGLKYIWCVITQCERSDTMGLAGTYAAAQT
jgi:hypothetical protein